MTGIAPIKAVVSKPNLSPPLLPQNSINRPALSPGDYDTVTSSKERPAKEDAIQPLREQG